MTVPVSSSLPSTVADRAAAPAAAAAGASVAAAGAEDEGRDSVELSEQADAAGVMLSAAQEASSETATNPALATFAADIASGIYKPPSAAIAGALVRYERRLLQGS